jgi:IS5 family transposase
MMGKPQVVQPKLFYRQFNLAERVGARNPLRAILDAVDFTWIRQEVQGLYGRNGNESIDPTVALKLFFLLRFENVPSARLLMERLPERLDWLWFCGFDLDSPLPDHSVLSKARRRWGRGAFQKFFARVLGQCVQAGLVSGRVLHVDGSLISADASMDSLQPRLELVGQELYDELDRQDGPFEPGQVSSTDPDARLRCKKNKLCLGYQEVRAVDDQCGVVTASVTTDAAADEGAQLLPAVEQHQKNVGWTPQTVVADKGFGTGENYHQLQQCQIQPCIPHTTRSPRQGRVAQSAFAYDKERDCYVCPQGQRLIYSGYVRSKKAYTYKASRKACAACPLASQCAGQRGRVLYRHKHQESIQWADTRWSRQHRRRLMTRRMHVMEGSFADAATHHGYKRARWRGLLAMTVQNLLVATLQNIRKLVRYARKPRAVMTQARTGQDPNVRNDLAVIALWLWMVGLLQNRIHMEATSIPNW